jgi:hypothetical protein
LRQASRRTLWALSLLPRDDTCTTRRTHTHAPPALPQRTGKFIASLQELVGFCQVRGPTLWAGGARWLCDAG